MTVCQNTRSTFTRHHGFLSRQCKMAFMQRVQFNNVTLLDQDSNVNVEVKHSTLYYCITKQCAVSLYKALKNRNVKVHSPISSQVINSFTGDEYQSVIVWGKFAELLSVVTRQKSLQAPITHAHNTRYAFKQNIISTNR